VVLDSDAVAERVIASRALMRDAFPADVDATLRFLEDHTAPAPFGWCLAAADPAARGLTWLRSTHLARRRRRPVYRSYAAAMHRIARR